MKPKLIDHIVIIVKNIQKTERFYGKFLGKPIERDRYQVVYKIGGTKIFLGLPHGRYRKYDKDRGGLNHLAFGAQNFKELHDFESILRKARIKNSGIEVDQYGKGEFIWFDDPDGHRLEFYLR